MFLSSIGIAPDCRFCRLLITRSAVRARPGEPIKQRLRPPAPGGLFRWVTPSSLVTGIRIREARTRTSPAPGRGDPTTSRATALPFNPTNEYRVRCTGYSVPRARCSVLGFVQVTQLGSGSLSTETSLLPACLIRRLDNLLQSAFDVICHFQDVIRQCSLVFIS